MMGLCHCSAIELHQSQPWHENQQNFHSLHTRSSGGSSIWDTVQYLFFLEG